ncbi:MAG TPA: glutamate--tRNA ligase [Buchnera sp. (in: enterobacteria)]|nr:glutamate--tRNA ligase [Buchnera sp. (in: enterobacteria)]
MTIKTRFAPSPTGYLHIGSARTALYSWLFAKHNKGVFVLRFEDTDLERSTESSVKGILDGLQWLGLKWNEGPYFQSKRLQYYINIIYSMVELGKAYKCYCSNDRLEKLRRSQILKGEKPRYDGKCRENKVHDMKNISYVIRFRNPKRGKITFYDKIRGKIIFENKELDDLIILRSNGIPTYNFCVVIDDRDMKITHVIRGEDHINNTPRQINILKSLGADIPVYAHVSIIMDSKGKKLSKRNNVIDVMEYCREGYLPEAILNYILRLGWSHGNQEIFSIDEMKKLFTLEGLSKSASRFNIKKLLWLNHYYINKLSVDYIEKCLRYHFKTENIDISEGPILTEIIKMIGHRCNTLKEMVKLSRYFYQEFDYLNNEITKKYLNINNITILKEISKKIAAISVWNISNLSDIIKLLSVKLNISLSKVAMPVRFAVTGSVSSPSIDTTIYFIGKDRVLLRIRKAINYINKYSNTKNSVKLSTH